MAKIFKHIIFVVGLTTYSTSGNTQSNNKQDSIYLEKINIEIAKSFQRNNIDEAIAYGLDAKDLAEKTFGKKSLQYINILNDLAGIYTSTGNLELRISLYKEALLYCKELYGDNNLIYARTAKNLGNLYSSIYYYNSADTLLNQVERIYYNQFGEHNQRYAESLNNLGVLNVRKENYQEAERLYKRALLITEKNLSEFSIDYADVLNNLGYLYRVLGNYSLAEISYKKVLEIRKKILGIKHSDYAASLGNLGTLYIYLGNYKASEPLLIEALHLIKARFGINNPYYATSLNNLGSLYQTMENYILADSVLKEALNIRKKVFGINHPDYAISLNNLGSLYDDIGKFDEAEKLYQESLTIRKNIFGESHYDYITNLNNLASLHYRCNQYIKWKSIINSTLEKEKSSQQFLLFNFSESEKQIFLVKEINNTYVHLSMLHYFKPQATNSFYQSTTAKQGWLLQGKQQLTQLANQSKDASVKSLLTQWQNTNRLYAQAIQLTTEKRKLNNINVDSLQELSQQLEKQLIAAMPALQAVITNAGFTGKEVAAKLKHKEAVVHWVSFQYMSPKSWTDSVLYAAYIFTANDTAPKFVTVFEEKQLQQILKSYHSGSGRSTIKKESSNNTNADIALYNLIWKPLLPYLQNATTVYNLPAGLLHKISFAALTDSSNKSLIDTYEIHQLLSINELVNPLKITNNHNTIALFGGANYDAVNTTTTASSTIAQAPMYRNATNNKYIHFNYLQGTKTEVETVATNAKNTNWKVQTYTNTNASEDNFKNLSGENAPKILHIATHGFYFPPTKTKPTNFITEDKNTPKDFPLLRSGLVLSGVNNYWGKDTLLENKEDGIVTAQEISNLNLLNTDLVVLSACQTALGDIDGSEGVYGLQRAFKMAGVKKLLMSLWEVPDAETAELMQLFYTNIFKGESYYTAFRKAQLVLKAKYKDPTKWAGFVLVGE